MHSDARGGDPDQKSPTLKKYHKLLWSKELPNGKPLMLTDKQPYTYLYHKSELGEFRFGSDLIVHSYINHYRKKWLTSQIQEEVQELENTGSTIGGYSIFPNNRIDGKHTINQARGVNRLIDDRFDLTLECIRKHYLDEKSPLSDVLSRYKYFFDLFESFENYVEFFLLQDLIDNRGAIKFYLEFNNFETPPAFTKVDDYLKYKERMMAFIQNRNQRINKYARQKN